MFILPQNGLDAFRIISCAKDTSENLLSGNQLIYATFYPALQISSPALRIPAANVLKHNETQIMTYNETAAH